MRPARAPILGTVEYMSPEQARGKLVDKRTDVWAFGCVLFQMLAGRAPFTRATTLDTLTAILEREPDWSLLPRDVPPALHEAAAALLDQGHQSLGCATSVTPR